MSGNIYRLVVGVNEISVSLMENGVRVRRDDLADRTPDVSIVLPSLDDLHRAVCSLKELADRAEMSEDEG